MAKPDIQQIASMLDDEDDNVALNVMVQLMARADELGDLPGILQESSNRLVRRRAHQLQVALNLRQRRESFHRRLTGGAAPELIPGLYELHLLWYDRDSSLDLRKLFNDFSSIYAGCRINSLEGIEKFMRKNCVVPLPESSVCGDIYCLGCVLDRRIGSQLLILALAAELTGNPALQIAKISEGFVLYDSENGKMLTGKGGWTVFPVPENEVPEIWNSTMVLKYISGMLLACAVTSDSFRYVMSFAQAISGDRSEHVFDDFPYPFRAVPDEDADENNQL